MLQILSLTPRRRSYMFWGGLVIVFVLALMPRLFYPSSRYMVWYDRSVHFWDALMTGRFGDTYQRHHPGVTTMWIAGFGLRLYVAAQGWSSDALVDLPPAMLSPQGEPAQAATAVLGFSIATCVILVYVLLVRMIGWSIAFCAGCLLALDPFYITHSKMIHVDGLLASFMLVSALFLIGYLREGSWAYLILSGIFAGLAFLTKSPSLFLIPYVGLAMLLNRLIAGDFASLVWSDARVWGRELWRISRSWAMWILVAMCILFLFWPALWSEPWKTVSRIARRVQHHVDTPHPGANFFAGQTTGELGLLYYLASLAWKTTLVTLPATCLAALYLTLRRPKGESRSLVWHVLAYAVGFLFLMTLGAKKWSRYILSTFLALDIVAAWGLVQAARTIGRQRWLRAWT
jgi:4-amino-4-deoxy-L-arabinose transferase-like glycosyltransferase